MKTKRSWTIQRTAIVRQALQPFKARLLGIFVYLVALLLIGTLGYMELEGWGGIDSLYMAVISLTAVGFSEVHPLSEAGRIFTMFLLAFSVIGLGMCWAVFTALIVESDLGDLLGRYRMEKKIKTLQDHFIICGLGRMGHVIADEVHRMGFECIVIESNQDRVNSALPPETPFLIGDATREQTLEDAGILRARGLAGCLTDDAENLLLCLTARGMRPDIEIVSRASDEESLKKLRRAGATHAVSPNITGAVRMASVMLRPSVVSFLDAATLGADISLRLEEAMIPPHSQLAGKTLADAKIPQNTGLVVLAIKAGDVAPRYNPGPETLLSGGDTVIVLGSPDQIEGLRGYVNL
jgi:voltage-gated potassium channel